MITFHLCHDCGAPVKAGALRCHPCAVSYGMRYVIRVPTHDKVCLYCTGPFKSVRSNAKWCTPGCYEKHRWQERKSRAEAAGITIRRSDEASRKNAEASARRREKAKDEAEAQRKRELDERIARINAKARLAA